MRVLDRNSNNINIATFWENHQLGKYNYDPSYQRPSDVWSESKKSFLIDTILKNFPMPPIFLHQHIDVNSGKTIYDVIDGKQRLTTIISFIENNVALPEDFSDDTYGDERLNGQMFSDLENSELSEWKKNFWKYELTIEYVDTDQIDIVNNIFDRLNRNGEPLTSQELRNARYRNSDFYNLILQCVEIDFWRQPLGKLEVNRLEHHDFISELLFVILEDQVFASDRKEIVDELFEKYASSPLQDSMSTLSGFNDITAVIDSMNLDFQKYSIYGVSHLYGIFCLAWQITKHGIEIENLAGKLDSFYSMLRNKEDNEHTKEYQISMNAGTKSRARRIRRINALLKFLDCEPIS